VLGYIWSASISKIAPNVLLLLLQRRIHLVHLMEPTPNRLNLLTYEVIWLKIIIILVGLLRNILTLSLTE
jgi:hypothetical protein